LFLSTLFKVGNPGIRLKSQLLGRQEDPGLPGQPKQLMHKTPSQPIAGLSGVYLFFPAIQRNTNRRIVSRVAQA
jgi:hypothetical protein